MFLWLNLHMHWGSLLMVFAIHLRIGFISHLCYFSWDFLLPSLSFILLSRWMTHQVYLLLLLIGFIFFSFLLFLVIEVLLVHCFFRFFMLLVYFCFCFFFHFITKLYSILILKLSIVMLISQIISHAFSIFYSVLNR